MTKALRPLRVIGYVRLSDYRGKEKDASTSPERQREKIRAMCEARGWVLVDIVEDLNVSGSDRGLRLDRPGLVEVRERYDEVDVLMFTKLDRLARNVIDFRSIADDAEKHDVAVVSIDDNIDLTTASGKFFATILAAFAEMEAATIRERVLQGNEKARDLGRFLGGVPPYGYRPAPAPDGAGRVLEVDPDEAKVVVDVAEKILSGLTIYRVTRDLNERGVPSKTGKTWSVQAVRGMLVSPRIVGRRLHAGKVLTDESGLPLQIDPPILSLSTWTRLRDLLDGNEKVKIVSRRPARLLSGLVFCGLCGARMNPSKTGGDGKFSYRCSTASRGRLCPGVSIRCLPLEDWITARFLERFEDVPIRTIVEHAPEEPVALVEIRAAIDDAGEAMKAPGADYAALGARLARLHEERERLEAQPVESTFEVVEEGTFGEVWHRDEDVERRRSLLERALREDRIRVSPGRAGRRPFSPDRVEYEWSEGDPRIDYVA